MGSKVTNSHTKKGKKRTINQVPATADTASEQGIGADVGGDQARIGAGVPNMPPIPKVDGAVRRSVREELERAPHLTGYVDLLVLRALLRRRYRAPGQTTDALLNISREMRAITSMLPPPPPKPEDEETVGLMIVPPMCAAHAKEVAECEACPASKVGVGDAWDEGHGSAALPLGDVLPADDPDRQAPDDGDADHERKALPKSGPAPSGGEPSWELPIGADGKVGGPVPDEPGVKRAEVDEVRLGRGGAPWTKGELNRPPEGDDGHTRATDGPVHDEAADGHGLADRRRQRARGGLVITAETHDHERGGCRYC